MSGVQGTSASGMLNYSAVNQMSGDLLKRLDTDSSGGLNKDEFKLSLDKFTKIDGNGDGSLSVDELNQTFYTMAINEMTSHALSEGDTNSDGLLSRDEFKIPGIDFSTADTNQDGFVDNSELFAANPAYKAYQTALGSQSAASAATTTQSSSSSSDSSSSSTDGGFLVYAQSLISSGLNITV